MRRDGGQETEQRRGAQGDQALRPTEQQRKRTGAGMSWKRRSVAAMAGTRAGAAISSGCAPGGRGGGGEAGAEQVRAVGMWTWGAQPAGSCVDQRVKHRCYGKRKGDSGASNGSTVSTRSRQQQQPGGWPHL